MRGYERADRLVSIVAETITMGKKSHSENHIRTYTSRKKNKGHSSGKRVNLALCVVLIIRGVRGNESEAFITNEVLEQYRIHLTTFAGGDRAAMLSICQEFQDVGS